MVDRSYAVFVMLNQENQDPILRSDQSDQHISKRLLLLKSGSY